jgi:hypothetical protein
VCIAGLAACGGSDDSQFGSPNDPNAGGFGGGGQFSTDPVGTNAACVTDMHNATLPAVNLVIMYDKSGSMGDPAEGANPNVKWVPVNAGMKAFFGDPKSSGYNASLQFFPAPGNVSATCGADYQDPLVPLTPLAKSASLAQALDGAQPQGGTPTLPALEGAIAYAKATIAARPEEKTVVVLVTDGEPGMVVNGQVAMGCADNDVAHVAAAASAAFTASPSIPTYVIGVGPDLSALDGIAAQGGTGTAFMISVSDPTQTRTQLQSAFDAIRSKEKVSCVFAVPAPPPGEQLDPGRVNVAFTNAAGAETPLVYSSDCSAPNGWRYDDRNNPTHIELCTSTCASAQSDPDSKLTIAFGCKTNVAVQ